ncbi:MAG: hypothetical protein QG640_199 [Patescibacteria group bacterium]|nr:hypothetical protein [Patescibacteria group bacterium]
MSKIKNGFKRISNAVDLLNKKSAAKKRYSATLGKPILKAFFKNHRYAAPLALLEKIKFINKKFHPLSIVEFGSGATTLAISRSMDPHAHLITLDESPKFLDGTRKMIEGEHAITYVYPYDGKKMNYSYLSNFSLDKGKINLVVIDGPTGNRFSEEALQVLDKVLGPKSICVIDDTDREDINKNAEDIAKKCGLEKHDYQGTVYLNHHFSILTPQGMVLA